MDPTTRQAFSLWTQAQPAVSAFVHAVVGDRAARDEILQEVALAVLESFYRYDTQRPFLPWALGIARNEIANARQVRYRTPVSLSDAGEAALADAVAAVSDQEHGRLSQLAGCLELLEGRPRQICDLRYRAGLSPARIASALGMQPNSVSKALQRIREELRACIERRVAAEGVQ